MLEGSQGMKDPLHKHGQRCAKASSSLQLVFSSHTDCDNSEPDEEMVCLCKAQIIQDSRAISLSPDKNTQFLIDGGTVTVPVGTGTDFGMRR